MKLHGLSLFAGTLLLVSVRALAGTLPAPATGANVDESRVTKTFLVDPANAEAADDEKHGTTEAPFATLRYACRTAAKAKDAGVGVKLILASGTYRETAEIPFPPNGKLDTDAPLVIEAAERDQAIIDGADTEGWSLSTWKIENNRWTHPWPFQRAAAGKETPAPRPNVSAAYRSGDLMFVNGTALRQVNTEAELAPGTFWGSLARTGSGKGREAFMASAIVQPPEDTEAAGAIVQVGVRPRGLLITSRRNVVVRGIMCQHSAAPTNAGYLDNEAIGVQLSGCVNALVEDVLSQWNDGVGVKISGGSDVTLRRVRALHNGGAGLMVLDAKNLVVEDGEVSFNYFRPEWGKQFDQPEVAAVFAVRAQGATWRRLHAVGNAGVGMEMTGTDLAVEDSVLHNNLTGGLSVLFADRVLVRRCAITGTKPNPAWGAKAGKTGGLILSNSRDVTLQSNVVAGNVVAQLMLWEPPVRAAGHSERFLLQHNVFGGLDASQLVCKTLDGDRAKLSLVPDYRSFDADENCFWNPALTEGFVAYTLPGLAAAAPTPPGATMKDLPGMSFDKWREFLSTRVNDAPAAATPAKTPEARSLWQDPQFANPAEGDYRFKLTGALADWDLPSDDASGSE